MKRKTAVYLGTILLALFSQPLFAQHAGHSMGGMGSGGNHSHTNNNAMKAMDLAMLTTAVQKSHFQSWSQNTQAFKQQLEEFRRPSVAAADYSSQLEALRAALDTNMTGHHEFIKSLSQPQQEGLKKAIKNIAKANESLAKAANNAISEFSKSKNAGKGATELQKVEKAVEKLLREQEQTASAMGIA
jgi:hypothetical protein